MHSHCSPGAEYAAQHKNAIFPEHVTHISMTKQYIYSQMPQRTIPLFDSLFHNFGNLFCSDSDVIHVVGWIELTANKLIGVNDVIDQRYDR